MRSPVTRKLGRGKFVSATWGGGGVLLVITDRESGETVSFSFSEIKDAAKFVADIEKQTGKGTA